MATLSCECGERFEAPEEQAGQTVVCPACGRGHSVPPAGPYYKLSSMKYLQAAQNAPVEPDAAPPTSNSCHACGGSGVCRMCKGNKRKGITEDVVRNTVFLLLFGRLSFFFKRVLGAETDYGSKYCMHCHGNGKCYSCRGLGVAGM